MRGTLKNWTMRSSPSSSTTRDAECQDSSVVIETTLRAGQSGNRMPVGTGISEPVKNGAEAHPASYAMGTVSLPVVNRTGRGVQCSSLSSADDQEIVSFTSTPLWFFVACFRVNFIFTFTMNYGKIYRCHMLIQ